MRNKILRALKKQGYTGGDEDVAAILAFCGEKGLSFTAPDGAAVDVKAAFAVKAAPIALDDADDDKPEPKADDADLRATVKTLKAQVADLTKAPNKTTAAMHVQTPKAFRANVARKAYDLRAAQRHAVSDPNERTTFKCSETAEAFGAFMRLSLADNLREVRDYSGRADDSEIVKSYIAQKALSTGGMATGGAFVPEEFIAELIDLKQEFGMARQFFAAVPMSGDQVSFPKHVDDPTVYFPGEGGSITASNATSAQVKLTAVKAATNVIVSNELMNDSAINVGDYVGRTSMRAIAKKEDQMAFIGDGDGPTYGGAVGATKALQLLDSTVANVAGLEEGAGSTWGALVDNDVYDTLARLTDQFHASAKMVCSRQFYFQVLVPFLIAGGGVTMAELAQKPAMQFAGYPIMFSQAMPTATAVSTVSLLIGDGKRAGYIGDVRGGSGMAMSEHRYFDTDQVAFRLTNRVAVNIYGVGNASSTAASREAGSIVGLITAA